MSSLSQQLKQSNRQLLSSLDVYNRLKFIAKNAKARFVEGELECHSTTALVHEVYLKLSQSSTELLTSDQKELIRQLGQAVRSVVVDLLRKQQAQKRCLDANLLVGQRFNDSAMDACLDADTLLKIDAIIEQMSTEYPEQAQAAVLYHFNSMKVPHIAAVLNLSDATVYNHLSFFRRYVQVELI